jgi:amino acid adenylation domain-containing protein
MQRKTETVMKDISGILLHSRFIKQKGYWEKKLSPDIVRTALPPDYSPRLTSMGTGMKKEPGNMEIIIPADVCTRLIAFSKGSDLSLYIVLLTTLKILVYRYANNKQLTIISPVYTEKISNDTLNKILFIQDMLDPALPFIEMLLQVRQSVLEAYENQDYPSDKLMEYLFTPGKLNNGRSISNIICLLRNIHNPRMLEEIDVKDKVIFSFKREENSIRGCVLYPPGVYGESFIRRVSRHFVRILENSLRDIKVKISGISLSTEEETKGLIEELNRMKTQYPREKTIHRLFEDQVERNADHIALSKEENQITYRQFNEIANPLARWLRTRGVKPDGIVCMMTCQSIETLFGIMAILKASGAFLPVDPLYPQPRKRFIVEDSGAAVLLTQERILTENREILYSIPGENTLLLDKRESYPGDTSNLESVNGPGDLAYVIYTSGTTGHPKGVMIEHPALVNYIWWATGKYVRNRVADFPLYTSISFDLTITSIFTPLVTGGAVVVYEDEGGGDKTLIWKIIDENRVGIIKLTPSHMQLIRYKKGGDIPGVCSIKRLILGGEELKTVLARDISKNFPHVEIYNEYGPTEATVGCMIYRYDAAKDNKASVPIGKPIDNNRVYILDARGELAPPGVVCEIYISGDGLTRGYLNRPALTGEKFIPDPFIPGGKMYRSGDLGRMLGDRNIEFMGRIDQQVKIRGYRIELGEIENRLLLHHDIKEAVLVVKNTSELTGKSTGEEDNYICAYIVSAKKLEIPGLRKFLSGQLPAHMIPNYFVQLDRIPVTPNGKVDRKALPTPKITKVEEYTAPRDKNDNILVDIWSGVLDIEKDIIGIDSNFFEMGGHSLKAISLVSKIHQIFNVKIHLEEIFKKPTIRELSRYIKEAEKDLYSSIRPIEKKEYYSLSSAQKRLYFIQESDPDHTAYNIPLSVLLEGKLNKVQLDKNTKSLIKRHESLRTSFGMIAGKPFQRIHPGMEFKIGYFDFVERGERVEEAAQDFVRPFDLSRPALLRLDLLKLEEEKHLLMMDQHHIITDGISMDIFVRELILLYEGKTIPVVKIQYKDFSQWQNKLLTSGEIEEQEEYWLKLFEGNIPVLNIPVDFPRSAFNDIDGDTVHFTIGRDHTEKLVELGRNEDATLFMVILAVYNVLLAKLSGQEDIIVGTTIAGRRHADLGNIIGIFVNMLALRNYPLGEQGFIALLRDLKVRTLKAFDHQDYQFEDLVSSLNVKRSKNRNPVFDVVFTYNSQAREANGPARKEIPVLKLVETGYIKKLSKFDLTLVCTEDDNKLFFKFDYRIKLFKKETIEKFAVYFKEITSAVLENPEKKISEIELIKEEEKRTILKQIRNKRGKSQVNEKALSLETAKHMEVKFNF